LVRPTANATRHRRNIDIFVISALATILCLIFVVKLMRIDRASSQGLSKALWLPTVWFIYCASRPLDEWFRSGQSLEGGGGGIESGSILDRYFLTLLLVIGLGILQSRRINWQQAIKNNFWLFALLLFMLLSILWSDFQFVSFKRWVRTAGTAIMALVVLSEEEPYEAIRALLRRTLYLVIPFSMLLVKYYPRLGVTFGRWSGQPLYAGVATNKNTLGELCMLYVFVFVWVWVSRRDDKEAPQPLKGQNACELIMMVMIFFLMKGPSGYGAQGVTYSATCIAVLVIGLGLFFLMRRFRTRLTQLGGWVALILVVSGLATVALYLMDTSPMAVAARLLGRDPTLTGRSDLIWDVLLPVAWHNPVLGLGYGAFWIKQVPGLTLDINEAHNGYLDVLLELGVVGLILMALVVWTYFRKARNELQEHFHWAAFRMSYLVLFLVHNWTETTMLRSREILWNLFVVFAVVYPQEWTGRVDRDRLLPEEETSEEEEKTPLKAESVAGRAEVLDGGTENAL
jgi:exopolysaccharide production protein ExoQ